MDAAAAVARSSRSVRSLALLAPTGFMQEAPLVRLARKAAAGLVRAPALGALAHRLAAARVSLRRSVAKRTSVVDDGLVRYLDAAQHQPRARAAALAAMTDALSDPGVVGVTYDAVRVPVANRVGAEGEGFRIAMAGLDGGRINIGACSLGGAQRCLDEAVRYTKERQQFGRAIADFQNTQFTLADMATDLEAARALLYLAAARVTDNAPDKTRFAAMAKRLATDTGSSVVDRALQLHGGYGYLQDYPIERFWRDLRVHSILEGTNQIMRVIVSRDMLRQ